MLAVANPTRPTHSQIASTPRTACHPRGRGPLPQATGQYKENRQQLRRPGGFHATYFPNWSRVQCQGLTVDIAQIEGSLDRVEIVGQTVRHPAFFKPSLISPIPAKKSAAVPDAK